MASKPTRITRSHGRLPTPEATPGVEDGRVKADAQREAAGATRSQESLAEIERILKCPEGSNEAILGVESSSSQDERLTSWRALGCKIHPNHCKQEKAQAAFSST